MYTPQIKNQYLNVGGILMPAITTTIRFGIGGISRHNQ